MGPPRTDSSAQGLMVCPEPGTLGRAWPGFWPSVRTAVEGETECHSASEELVICPWRGLGRPPADLCLLLPRTGRYHGLRAGVGT